MISVRSVSRWFGSVQAVREVSFEIPPGQVVGLLGPNGAGKTTTIRMVTGFLPPSAGAIEVCGFDTIDRSIEARRSIGYLPESAATYPEMRVRDYLIYRARLFGVARRARRDAIDKAGERCRLTPVMHRRIGQLSKGYRQRVGLASTLVHNPPVLVLDEPTNGLDPTQVRETRSMVKELATDRTVLVSSHILPEVERTCDRVIIVAQGRVRADGSPGELLARFQGGGLGGDVSAWGYRVDVLCRAAGDIAGTVAAMRGLAGVREVKVLEEAGGSERSARLRIVPLPGHPDLREGIARLVGNHGGLVCELHREAPTLEQLFVRVIEAE